MPYPNNDYKKQFDLQLKKKRSLNSVSLMVNREQNKQPCYQFPHHMQSLPALVANLKFHKQFEGHRGCVNCIEFSEDGRYLISGSDDTKIVLWDMIQMRCKRTFNTGHRGNIFTVKFLPKTADNYIVSGAGDNRIEVKNISSGDVVSTCHCHTERVKRIATLPLSCDVYFSASEDGTVRQFDRRVKHRCSSQTANVLVDLRYLSDVKLETKCLAVNPVQSEMIAVGATDGYIRVYDRRKLTLTSNEVISKTSDVNSLPAGCVQYFTPGHLPDKMTRFISRLFKTLAITYLSFSPNGRDLLANIGGDNVYIFDMLNASLPKNYALQSPLNGQREKYPPSRISMHSRAFKYQFNVSKDTLHFESLDYLFNDGPREEEWYPEEVKDLVSKAESVSKSEELLGLWSINKAIDLWPYSCSLYVSRADSYLRRAWDGDLYEALRDCEKALELEPSYKKALFKKIMCLHYMRKDQEALSVMEADRDIMARMRAKEAPLIAIHEFLSKSRDAKIDEKYESNYSFLKLRKQEVISKEEEKYRISAKDYLSAYNGHCNTTTDIKEATFIGSGCEFIAAGSDDGHIFIWDRKTTNLARVIKADQSIVNCVQFHPQMCMMATSGIESVIKLWTPDLQRCEPLEETDSIMRENQLRMRQDPMEVMMFPLEDFRLDTGLVADPVTRRHFRPPSSDDDSDDERPFGRPDIPCGTS